MTAALTMKPLAPMDLCTYHGIKVLVLRLDGDYAAAGTLCVGAFSVRIADLEPLAPPHWNRTNGSDEIAESVRSEREAKERRREERRAERAAFDGDTA